MTLSVLGLGLRSPAGTNAREHVFFVPAGAPAPAPAAFVLADGSPFWVGHARFVLPTLVTERLFALALGALEEARPEPGTPLVVGLPDPRPGLAMGALDALANRLAEAARASSVERVSGAAGIFSALSRKGADLARGAIRAATFVAVDSFFHDEAASAFVTRPPSPFERAPLPLSEAAGALVVSDAAEARRLGRDRFGEILTCAAAMGMGKDDDDEPVDAAALAALLRGLPEDEPIRWVFGQGQTDPLRSRDWEWAVARAASRFHPEAEGVCLEADIGRIGAAAGIVSLVQALAAARHGAIPAGSRFLSWAVSRDGTRGLALGKGAEKIPEGTQTPLVERPLPRRIEGLEVRPERPFSSPPEEEPFFEAEDFDPDALFAAANDVSPPLPELSPASLESPAVRLDIEKIRPTSVEVFRAEVVAHCLETLSMLGKSRATIPRRAVLETERRMLCQVDAIVATGPRALVDLAAAWAEDLADPFRSFGGTIAALAFEGSAASTLVLQAISARPDDSLAHARLVAEALGLYERADLFDLGRSLLASATPTSRAAGLLFLAGRGALPAAEVRRFFSDSAPIVRNAALDSCFRIPAPALRELSPTLRDLVATNDLEFASRAARLLAILGDPEVRRSLRESSLSARLGPLAAELFVLAAGPEEASAADFFFTSQTPTPALLSAAARWGRPAVLPRLLQNLSGDDLVEPAAAALGVMLGAGTVPKNPLDAGAWRRKIGELRLAPDARLRRGSPYSTAVVADECAAGDLPRAELGLRIDELRARTGRIDPVNLFGWWTDSESSLAPLLSAARKGKG